MDALDLIEIHQLLAEYGHAIDAKDWDRFASLFQTDAEMDYRSPRNPNIFHGVVEFVDHLKTGNHPPAHHVTNIFAFERDGAVHVHSKFLVPYSRPTLRAQLAAHQRPVRRCQHRRTTPQFLGHPGQ
jgi:SnoaL-like domain